VCRWAEAFEGAFVHVGSDQAFAALAFRSGDEGDGRVAVCIERQFDAASRRLPERIGHVPGDFAVAAGIQLARSDRDFRARAVCKGVALDFDNVGHRGGKAELALRDERRQGVDHAGRRDALRETRRQLGSRTVRLG
jgi:hypothetical protein